MTESSTRGLRTGKDKTIRTDPAEFRKNHAVIIGIDQYSNGISPLATAGNDARRLAQILDEQYDYSITLLVEEVTRSRLQSLFQEELPEQVDPNDRLLIYFAGHGVALDGENGPEGYLIPQDATLDEDSFWPMTELHKALDDLPCRHMLAILDCCFAGAFRWSSTRDLQPLPSVIYRERYERFLRDPAWQVITSAAYNQKALDTLSGYVVGTHGVAQDEEQPHSPFALSLFEALHGAADSTPKDGDGIITATELYLYLRDQVEVNAEQLIDHRQTPGLWPLNKHRQGEFIFLLPDYELDLPPAPDLTEENNPYKGLSAYEKNDSELFFGRTDLIKELQQQVEEQPFTVVLGASGTGKSSLVKAGLLPALNKEETNESAQEDNFSQTSSWFILEKEVERNGKKKKRIMRPGTNPAAALRSLLINDLPGVRPERKEGATPAGMIGQWRKKHPGKKLLLIIDQFEEIITLCQEEEVREDFIDELMQTLEEHSEVLRVVLTLRSDFEAQISQNYLKDWWQEDNRFVVPPMTQNELREVIEQPASVMVLYFEPRELVDRLINEVIQTPGALPLLSFTLSELYRRYIERQKDVEQQDGNRALTEVDYEAIGGVIGSLRRRIDNEYEKLPDAAHKEAMKRIMLRMVAFEGGELTRRRVPIWEFDYPDAAENERVKVILDRLLQVRLIVGGKNEDSKGGTESYVEPAHDALVVAWDKLLKWRAEEAESMLLQRQLTRAAADWEGSSGEKEVKGLLWDNNPRLLRTQEILREKRSGTTKVAKRSGLFRGLKQFWRVLFPSYKDLDQYIWLNQVETGFVRRSIERKQNWTWGVTVFILAVVVSLASAGGIAWQQKGKAESELAKANYNLAKAFENEALGALEKVDKDGHKAYKQAVLFTSAALEQQIKEGKSALKYSSKGRLFAPKIFHGALTELWISPSLKLHDDGVSSVTFSPNGEKIASASYDKTIRLWDIETGTELAVFKGHEEAINSVAFSPDGKKLASASNDKTVRQWDIETGTELAVFKGHGKAVNSVAFSPDGKKLASASNDKTVRQWDIETGTELTVFKGHEKAVNSVAFSPDGKKLASASNDKTVRQWDIETGTELAVFKGHEKAVNSVAFSPDGKKLASASNDKTVWQWDIETGTELAVFKGHEKAVNSVAFSPDGKKLASASNDKTVRQWDIETGTELAVFKGHKEAVYSMGFSPNGKKLASASGDNTLRLWDIQTEKELTLFKGDVNFANYSDKKIAFSPDGGALAVSNDKTLRVWDIQTNTELAVFKGHEEVVNSMVFSPDGKKLVSASDDKTVRLWDIQTGTELAVFKGHEDAVNSVAFSPDGKKLVSASDDKTVRQWDIETGTKLAVFKGHEEAVYSMAFSPDGKKLVSVSDDMVQLCDIQTGKEFIQFKGHESYVTSVAFSPDEKKIALASYYKTVQLWDIQTGTELAVFKGHEEAVYSVAFSPDGKKLVSASDDKTVRLWDIQTGTELAVFKGHEDAVYSVAFSPNGRTVASVSQNSTVRLWNIPTGPELAVFKGHGDNVQSVALSPDGRVLLLDFRDNTVWLWNRTGSNEAIFNGYKHSLINVIFTQDGRALASTESGDSTLRLWDIHTGKELIQFKGHESYVNEVVLSPDGKTLAVNLKDEQTMWLWDFQTGKRRAIFKGKEYGKTVGRVIFCPDGRALTSTSSEDDYTLRLWDIHTGKELIQFKGHESYVNEVALSPDGKTLASASSDYTLRLWDIQTGKQLAIFEGHEESVGSVVFCLDGKTLASASFDNTVRLWDIQTGKELAIFEGDEEPVQSLILSPDGKTLASVSQDSTVRLWDLRPYILFWQDNHSTPLYRSFIQGVKFLWHVKLDGLEFVPDYTRTLIAQDGYNFVYDPKFRPLLNPPPPGQSKFDQVLEWAQQQEKEKNK